jgi:hypothetical protein
VRVGPDDQHAGLDVTVLQQHDVGDARVDVVERVDALPIRELAAEALEAGGLGGPRRRDVVHHHRDPLRMTQLPPRKPVKRLDAAPAGRVAHVEVRLGGDDLAGLHLVVPRRAREELFGEGACGRGHRPSCSSRAR